MLNSTKFLLTTVMALTTLTACDKKEAAKTQTATVSATATSTTTATTVTKTETVTADSTPAPMSAVASVTPVTNHVATPTLVESTTPKTEIKEVKETVTPTETVAISSSSPSVKFPASKNASLVTQAVKAGTPEATVKNMMDAMMTGTPQQVASYYGVDDPDLAQALTEQQPMARQQLKHLQLGATEYNKDKSKAIIVGKMTLNDNKTNEVGYKLQKINGEWKLMP